MITLLKKLRMSYIRWKYRRFVSAGRRFTCGRGTIFFAQNRIVIGENVYFGRYCNIECDANIGNEVLIANNVGFVGKHDHAFRTVGVPVRSAPSVRDAGYVLPEGQRGIVVEDDVWIGYGATVLSGVKIGEGAIVAACSLVTRDVEPFSIVAGVPARKVGMRFEKGEIEQHVRRCVEGFPVHYRTLSHRGSGHGPE